MFDYDDELYIEVPFTALFACLPCDIEWEVPLDEDGYPIVEGTFCQICGRQGVEEL